MYLNKRKTKLQILALYTILHSKLTSNNTLMVRCCTNICLLPNEICEAFFKNTEKTLLDGPSNVFISYFQNECERKSKKDFHKVVSAVYHFLLTFDFSKSHPDTRHSIIYHLLNSSDKICVSSWKFGSLKVLDFFRGPNFTCCKV